jgi:hypothetical protein
VHVEFERGDGVGGEGMRGVLGEVGVRWGAEGHCFRKVIVVV